MRAGPAGDDHVRVLGAELVSVSQAAFESGEAERVERHLVRPATEHDRSRCGVDVVDGEWPQFAGRRGVQQREQPDERLVWVTVTGRPATQQPGLVSPAEGAAAEPAGWPVRETGGWVGEADPLLAREVEEVAQRSEPEPAVTASSEERLDMQARAGRPVADAVAVEADREGSEYGETLLDRVVFQWTFADPSGAVATGEQPGEVALGGGAQRRRAALDPALASTVSEATLLVAGEHQAFGEQERLQQPGSVSRTASGPATVRHGRDHRGGSVNASMQHALKPAQVPPSDAGRAPLNQPAGERAEPLRAAFAESILRALDPDADDQRVALIARVAEPVRSVAAHATAAHTCPGSGLLAWCFAANAPPAARSRPGRSELLASPAAGADLLLGVVLGAPIARLAALARVKLSVIAAVGADSLHQKGGGVRERL